MEPGEPATTIDLPVSPMAATVTSPDPQARPATSLERGAVVGRYIALSRIGAGGMGVVYAAYDPDLDRKVALKLLLSETPGEPRQARLLREAQAMARLSHPNICAVYDVGTLRGQVFFAMELVDGVTLRTWLEEQARTWAAILAVFLAAGRGVAAAHAEGIVHGDLKPENIMIGADGRPRVMDFGIARADRTSRALDPTLPSAPDWGLADDETDGRLFGTLQYMAPEQWHGRAIDPRSDQFSFCVALWEALHRERPFAGKTFVELEQDVERGPGTPARRSGTPSWLRQVLQRGLSPAPGRRFPTMDALLAALTSGQARRRRSIAGFAAAGLVFAVVGTIGARSWERRQVVAACEATGASIVVAPWSEATRSRLRESLAARGVRDADATFSRVAAWIDRFAQRWQRERSAACLAGDMRTTACLYEQRQELAALLAVLSDDDPRAVPRAVAAAASLPDPATCGEPTVEARGPRETGDAQAWLNAAALRQRLHRARSLGATTRPAEALTLAREVMDQATSAGERALAIEATAVAGDMADSTGDYATAERLLLRAVVEAGAAGLDDIAADAATRLLRTVGLSLARHADGLAIGDFAEMLVGRIGQAERLRGAQLRSALAAVRRERGELAMSQALYARAIELLERELGREHPELAATIDQLAVVFKDRGEYREALRMHAEARAISEAVYGPEHPEVASCLINIAVVHTHLGEHEQALELLVHARATLVRALGPEHPAVARATINVGNALFHLGRYAEAIQEHGWALAIFEAVLGPKHPNVALALNNLGNTQQTAGAREAATRNYRRALAIWEETLGPDHPRLVSVLQGIGQLAMELDRPHEALGPYERSVLLAEKHGLPRELLADARARLAQAVWAVRRDRAEALRLAGLAAAVYRTMGESRAPVLAMLEAWTQHELAE